VQKLCKLYGLNEAETQQLIEELKNSGEEPHSEASSSMIRSEPLEESREINNFQSFKDEFKFSQRQPQEDSRSESDRLLQSPLFLKLAEENHQLKKEKDDLGQKLTLLLQLKEQQSEVVLGLKDNISTFADIIREKDQQYNLLLEKYNGLLQQHEEAPCSSSRQLRDKSRPRELQSSKAALKDISLPRRSDKENKRTEDKRCRAVLE
jgi:hypothetical protein